MSLVPQNLIGESDPIEGVRRWLEKAAALDAPVVIEGESGTGKLLATRRLHHLSPRQQAPCVVVYGESLNAEQLERAILAATTGGVGTLVIRHIEKLAKELQPRLTLLLEMRERLRGVAGGVPLPRVVATAVTPLREAVRQGHLREDLFFRLAVLVLEMPPLRERLEDLPALVRGILAPGAGATAVTLTPPALEKLRAHAWPQNVRELQDVLAHLRGAGANIVDVSDLPALFGAMPQPSLGSVALRAAVTGADPSVAAVTARENLAPLPVSEHLLFKEAKEKLLAEFEKEYLRRLLTTVNGSITRAAERSGLHRKSIERLVKKYALRPRRRRKTK
ncbi:MAG: sigma-54-dependent transcriptional regulator [Myxococcaceae bacterium]